MTISRMQNPQQLQGIGSLRQPYGLGKLVKKAFRGIKKIAKSPLGKAAIIGGLGMIPFGAAGSGGLWSKMGGMMRAGSGGGGIWGAIKGGAGKLGGFMNPWAGGTFSGKKLFGLGAGAAIAAPFLQKALKWGPYQEDEEEGTDWSTTPGSIANIRNMARNRDPSLAFMPSPDYVQSGFYAADGGRAGLLNGGGAGEAQMEQMLRAEYLKYKNKGGTMPYEQFKILVMKQAQQGQTPSQMMAAGGRTGYLNGEMVEQQTDLIKGPQGTNEFQETVVEGQEQPSREQLEALAMEIFQLPLEELDDQQLLVVYQEAMQGQPVEEAVQEEDVQFAANGGRIGAQEGGLMDLGGQEKDYRENGGFVPLGEEERADDVPARLSKNEFVFTADAVRAAGGGDIDAGSEVMQNVMDNLEQGGEISEESQGQNPAQGMYNNYEQLQSRVA